MIDDTAFCCLCQQPVMMGEPYLPLEKGRVHPACHQQDGRPLEEVAESLVCCPGREAVLSLAGCAVYRDSRIPMNEVWFVDKPANAVYRHRLLPHGPVLLETLPTVARQDVAHAQG